MSAKNFALTGIFFLYSLVLCTSSEIASFSKCPAFCLLSLSYNTQHKHPCPPVGFQPAIPAGDWQQNLALDRSPNGTRSPDRPTCSESLYWLRYPSPLSSPVTWWDKGMICLNTAGALQVCTVWKWLQYRHRTASSAATSPVTMSSFHCLTCHLSLFPV